MGRNDTTDRLDVEFVFDALGDAAVPCLEATAGVETGRLIPLQIGTNIVGRAPTHHVSVDHQGVSRRHAKLLVSDDRIVTLHDFNSTNGTFVNGAKVTRIPLREGDRVQFGPKVCFRFGYRGPAELREAITANLSPEPEAPPSAPVDLTPREQEIAQWVAEGLNNEQIGKRLFISPRTVGTHLSNIYSRLEIHSRAELTRYVLEKGLLERPHKG